MINFGMKVKTKSVDLLDSPSVNPGAIYDAFCEKQTSLLNTKEITK